MSKELVIGMREIQQLHEIRDLALRDPVDDFTKVFKRKCTGRGDAVEIVQIADGPLAQGGLR